MVCENTNEFIVKIDPPVVRVKSPDGDEYVVNEYEWHHLRVQIKKAAVEGWSWFDLYDGTYQPIDKTGRMWHHPPQFDMILDYSYELL